MRKFVFLYTEIAGYFLACVNKLAELPGVEVHIFRYPVNKEAPFEFKATKNVFLYEKNSFHNKALLKKISEINPDIIICSGWVDDDYLKIIKTYDGKVPTLLGFDNKWENSLKQNIASVIAPLFLTKNFSHCFVPGQKQKKYAMKLGFSEKQILSGLYSADFDLFNAHYKINAETKKAAFPKKFLYAARYVKHKGIEDLWAAFIELQNEFPNDWELWCAGTGEVTPVYHPRVKHFGFIQPENLGEIISKTGVYVLPSHFEPWGVSLHEFAAAGFPLVCSDEVGASEIFLEDGANGFLFRPGSLPELKTCLKKIMRMPENELWAMSERSVEKARIITPGKWAASLFQLSEGSR